MSLFRSAFVLVVFSVNLFCPGRLDAACLFGIGNCNGGIIGSWVSADRNAVLKIDSAQIIATRGALTITVNYDVRQVDGNTVMIDFKAPGEPGAVVKLVVDGNVLHFYGTIFAGDWQAK